MYNLQSKTVNWYSQNSLRDTPHLKVLNNHVLNSFGYQFTCIWALFHRLLFNESLLHYLSIMLPWWCFVSAWMPLCIIYILVYTSACDELWFFTWLSLLPPALLWWLSVCLRYNTDFNSSVCYWINWFTLKCPCAQNTVFYCNLYSVVCKCVYSFSVFFTKLFWQPQLPKWFL